MLDSGFSQWPSYTKEEADAVSSVLMSNRVNYWTGNKGREFEKEFAAFADSDYAVALANGTVALDLAFKAIDLRLGDEVIVTPRTFLASVSSIVNCGGIPVFADVDLCSQNITAETIRAVLTPKTKAIVCVHLAGWPCEMDDIMALAEKKSLWVIEDCAQAHGAKYKGRSVGGIGHIGAWSFCQDKIMTTGGEGGMVTTNDYDLWSKMWSYKDHGKSWNAIYQNLHPSENGFRWLHESFGTNWRMTEMQACIGRIQINRMDEWHARRILNLQTIWGAVRRSPGLIAPEVPPYIEHAAYKCYAFLDSTKLPNGVGRDQIMANINGHGVPCFAGSCPEVYLEKAFDGTSLRPKSRLPNAKLLGESSIMFLVHPTLTEEEISQTCSVISGVMNQASLYA